MPPSPALRCLPGQELRTENAHKRGHSLESGFLLKAKDDDLALFNDMQSRDRDNFLLLASDDLDDSIAKLRYYSDFKLGINIPARGESSDLLNANGEKNDYDWLLTPPDTPLFPSLDDEEPLPVASLAPRGRQRSQPIAIRSSMTERAQRSSRSSSSPHRLSSSPRSSSSVSQPRGTPPSAPHSSPTVISRSTTPSRRSSTPPNKSSMPTPQSSTPTTWRVNNGSNGQASSSGRRVASPIRASRGNSASPKLRGWQTSLPGFSSNPPPNLRTSLADRPSSYTRGLSPASRGRHSMSPTPSRNRRQSMSPTASRTSSSHSHDRDCFSSYSKGSAASSCDDDVTSMNSSCVGISCNNPTGGKNGTVANNRVMTFSKKPVRNPAASSAPKRSFDSALRQMDHRKTPQNMFRPLLSSVPTSAFYIGQSNGMHHRVPSRNSSLTTSSNASSEQGASIVPDMETTEHDRNDMTGEHDKAQGLETQDEVFLFDKVEKLMESRVPVGGMTNRVDFQELEKVSPDFEDAAKLVNASESSCAADNPSEINCPGILSTCTRCGKQFPIMDRDQITDICQECAEDDGLFTEGAPQTPLLITRNENLQSQMADGRARLSNEMQVAEEIPELPEKSSLDVQPNLHEMSTMQARDILPKNSGIQSDMYLIEEDHSEKQPNSCQELKASQSASPFQQPQEVIYPSPRVESLKGTGISVLLLQRSGSSKWPVVQGRFLSATNILCSEPSYARDHANSIKQSISRDSASLSLSVDLGSPRQSEQHVQRQLSSRKGEMENGRNECNAKALSAVLSNSAVSSDACEAVIFPTTENTQQFDGSVDALQFEALGECGSVNEQNILSGNVGSSCTSSSVIMQAVTDGNISSHSDTRVATDSSGAQFESHTEGKHVSDTSAIASLKDKGCTSFVKSEDLLNNEGINRDTDAQVDSSSVIKECITKGSSRGNDDSGVTTCSNSCISLGPKIDLENDQNFERDSTTVHDLNNMDVSHECSVSALSEKDLLGAAFEPNFVDHNHEKSTVTVEQPRGHMLRSVTLEEATDTILFCSSIIHDLAYKAATIGMEKEESASTEPPRPMVTILGKTFSNQRDSWTSSYKRMPKPQKTKRKRFEANTNTIAVELEDDTKVKNTMHSNPELPHKVDSAKSPKLESKCNCTIM